MLSVKGLYTEYIDELGQPVKAAQNDIFVTYADHIDGPWSDPQPLGLHAHIDPCHALAEDGSRWLFLSGGDRVRLSDDGLRVAGEGALLAALERNRTGRMGDIVATIQAEQDEAIRADLTNTDLLFRVLGMMFPGLDPGPLVRELRDRRKCARHRRGDQPPMAHRGHSAQKFRPKPSWKALREESILNC